MDINGNIIEFNEMFLNLYKFSTKDVQSLSVFDIIDPIEAEGFNKKWDNIIKGIGFNGQLKTKAKDHTEKWMRGAFSAVYDMYGEVEKIVFIGQDYTSEKQIEIELRNQSEVFKKQEKQLRESEKELSRKLREARIEMQHQYREIEHIKMRNEKILEDAVDAIITTSHDNKIVFFNLAAEKLWGFPKQEVLNQDIGILFSNRIIEENEFLISYTGPGDNKLIGVREKIKIVTKQKKVLPVSIMLSRAQVENEITYTAFIQQV
jgi:PAS domain S-box-containing protein